MVAWGSLIFKLALTFQLIENQTFALPLQGMHQPLKEKYLSLHELLHCLKGKCLSLYELVHCLKGKYHSLHELLHCLKGK
jgi:hypothetical protein